MRSMMCHIGELVCRGIKGNFFCNLSRNVIAAQVAKTVAPCNIKIICYATQQMLTLQPLKRSLQLQWYPTTSFALPESKFLPFHHLPRSFPALSSLDLKSYLRTIARDIRLRCKLQKVSVTRCNGYKNAGNPW